MLDVRICARMNFWAPLVSEDTFLELHRLLLVRGSRRSSCDDPSVPRRERTALDRHSRVRSVATERFPDHEGVPPGTPSSLRLGYFQRACTPDSSLPSQHRAAALKRHHALAERSQNLVSNAMPIVQGWLAEPIKPDPRNAPPPITRSSVRFRAYRRNSQRPSDNEAFMFSIPAASRGSPPGAPSKSATLAP